MCGIAGRANVWSDQPVDRAVIEAMCGLIAHRGPDGWGVEVKGEVGLGHRRLAIIDLSPAGRQPMCTPDGRYWVTFNGEIYNFLELRRQLEQRGRAFVSSSDTEVLLAAFAEFGVECLALLRGMFAFGIWDTHQRRLFLARDRVGKKPLFYRTDRHGIAFASESKAFFAEPGFEAAPNLAAIDRFLALMYVPAPLSAFEGVSVLPPAHYLVADAQGVKVERYWKLRYEPKMVVSDSEAEEIVEHELREAVRLRLISDVPLGAFLSGGVDSGVVVALMAECGGQAGTVRTFSIGFNEREFSELQYARLVAERYGTQHHELVVEPTIGDLLPSLVWHYGEPFADPSAVPTYYLSRMTRRHVTVALNGDGGDESFAGYDCYVDSFRNAVYERVPRRIRQVVGRAASTATGSRGTSLERAARWLAHMGLSRDERYARSREFFDGAARGRLLDPMLIDLLRGSPAPDGVMEKFVESNAVEWVDRMLSVDVETYLPDALLTKVDIATMANGLEGRSPLLDHVFMERVASLPSSLKLRGRAKKFLLKRVAAKLLPASIVQRAKKGFSVPIVHWLRTDLRTVTGDVLLSDRAARRGFVRRERVEELLREHWSGERDWHDHIWGLLMLELWATEFLDRRPAAAL